MHGDYQFANVMYHHGAPARLAAIVDWEMGTVGDPKLDLAWVVQSWPEEGTDGFDLGYVDLTGMPTRDQLLARYAETSGRQVDDIDYYVVLARWKLAIVLEQGFQRAGDDPKLDRVRRHRARAHGGCRRAGRDERLPVNGQRSVADRFDLRGKVAVVTGGSRGIGRAVALGLAGAGADVVIASRKLDQVRAGRRPRSRDHRPQGPAGGLPRRSLAASATQLVDSRLRRVRPLRRARQQRRHVAALPRPRRRSPRTSTTRCTR